MACACDIAKLVECFFHKDLDADILAGAGFTQELMSVEFEATDSNGDSNTFTKWFTNDDKARDFIARADMASNVTVLNWEGFTIP